MAIDTPLKRRAAAHVARNHGGKGVTPDAAQPLAWRQTVAWIYGAALTPPGVTFVARDRIVLGQKEAFNITTDPNLGGWSR